MKWTFPFFMTTQHSLIACVRNSRHRAHVFLYTRACSTCNHIARIVLSYIPPHPTFSLVPTLEKTCPVLLWSKSGPSYQNINILCQSSEKTQYFHSAIFTLSSVSYAYPPLKCKLHWAQEPSCLFFLPENVSAFLLSSHPI